jgi:ketosteroid isomerase-like protein
MKVSPISLIVFLLLCTCDRAPSSRQQPTEEAVAQLEEVLAGAYQTLDAAVIDRLLAPDFVVIYSATGEEKSRRGYLAELATMRQVFPELTVELQDLSLNRTGDTMRAEGTRHYSWRMDGQTGSYREPYRNDWTWTGEDWLLTKTTLLSPADR